MQWYSVFNKVIVVAFYIVEITIVLSSFLPFFFSWTFSGETQLLLNFPLNRTVYAQLLYENSWNLTI